jgi:hypothetical protein
MFETDQNGLPVMSAHVHLADMTSRAAHVGFSVKADNGSGVVRPCRSQRKLGKMPNQDRASLSC